MKVPEKILTRKEEITAGFQKIMEQHISDLLHNKASKLFHSSDFAAQLFIHPRHLTNTLKLTTGKSPCEFMEDAIMQESKGLLKNTDLPIAQIGARFMYFDASNFTKFFKSMEGITPMQYRKQHKMAAA